MRPRSRSRVPGQRQQHVDRPEDRGVSNDHQRQGDQRLRVDPRQGPAKCSFQSVVPRREFLQFDCLIGEPFKEPGIYRVSWKGVDFQSSEIVLRILPEGSLLILLALKADGLWSELARSPPLARFAQIDCPASRHNLGDDAQSRSAVSPLDRLRLSRRLGAEAARGVG